MFDYQRISTVWFSNSHWDSIGYPKKLPFQQLISHSSALSPRCVPVVWKPPRPPRRHRRHRHHRRHRRHRRPTLTARVTRRAPPRDAPAVECRRVASGRWCCWNNSWRRCEQTLRCWMVIEWWFFIVIEWWFFLVIFHGDLMMIFHSYFSWWFFMVIYVMGHRCPKFPSVD